MSPQVSDDSRTIKDFYDHFLHTRMLGYRVEGNERIEKAISRILPFVLPSSNVLDIGCGIGLVVQRIANRARHGTVWGCDISEMNVWYAQRTVTASNAKFFVGDVVNDPSVLRRSIPHPIDVFTLIDVVEHLPLREHANLFKRIRELGSSEAVIILTYPSPQYQRFLHEHNPDELQPVDEIVELDHLLAAAQEYGFSLKHFSLEDVWSRNQYIHCVLQTGEDLGSMLPHYPTSYIDRVRSILTYAYHRYIRAPYRKYKYIDSVFRC